MWDFIYKLYTFFRLLFSHFLYCGNHPYFLSCLWYFVRLSSIPPIFSSHPPKLLLPKSSNFLKPWCPSSMVWFKRNLIQVDVQWCPSTPSYQAKSSMVFFLQPMSAMVFFLQAIKPCLPLSSSQCPMMSKSFLPWFSFALSRDVCHGFLPPSKQPDPIFLPWILFFILMNLIWFSSLAWHG